MNSDNHNIDSRLRRLQGQGAAPNELWARIETQIAATPPARSRLWPRSRWAAAAAAVFLSVILLSQYSNDILQNPNDAASPQPWLAYNIMSDVAALDKSHNAFTQEWSRQALNAASPMSAFVSPQIQQLQSAREEVLQALTQQPDSPTLLRHLATLDHWQYRLLREMVLPHDNTV